MSEETEAGAEFIGRFDAVIPVKVAFWLNPTEAGRWYLYIASDEFDDQNLGPGYREVLRQAKEHSNFYVDPFRVRLIPARDPRALAALDIHRRYPSQRPTRIGAGAFGGMSVDGVFIYPAAAGAPTV
ncbi:hypothetical protein [Paludisphaera rhizosphaerae]|uniref:hypothetical protein n=1 Tax=Paludisphaera rhizosphaerae TaxID=2711216 RepID=UPI0013ED00C7|nr:hypothetical protein [Paludisphaera rhizosphaerae]